MKNKIILFLFIFILISFLFINNNVFAYEVFYNETNFSIPDEIIDIAKTYNEYSELGDTKELIIWQDPNFSNNYCIGFFDKNYCLFQSWDFGNTKKELSATGYFSAHYYDTSFNYVKSERC